MAKIDLAVAGSHSVRIGKPDRRYTAVRYNHKPTVKFAAPTSTISRGPKDGECQLAIGDGRDKYTYRGHGHAADAIVLLVDEDGSGFTMTMVDASIACNLTSAPWEPSEHKLAEKYPLLVAENGPDEDSPAESPSNLDDADPDPSNPFDFRHYIDTFAAQEVAKSPLISAASPKSTPVHTPYRGTMREAPPKTKPVTRKVKQHVSLLTATSKRQSPKAPKAAAPSAPQIRVRAASVVTPSGDNAPSEKITFHFDDSPSSHDDDGDLVLDEAPAPKPANHAAHLRATDGAGPVSLRSAASSPGSAIGSPLTRPPATSRLHDTNAGLEIRSDSDIEDLNIGTAASAVPPRRSSGITADEDNDAELEAEMLRAMEEADDEDDAPAEMAQPAEEEEESEEE